VDRGAGGPISINNLVESIHPGGSARPTERKSRSLAADTASRDSLGGSCRQKTDRRHRLVMKEMRRTGRGGDAIRVAYRRPVRIPASNSQRGLYMVRHREVLQVYLSHHCRPSEDVRISPRLLTSLAWPPPGSPNDRAGLAMLLIRCRLAQDPLIRQFTGIRNPG